MFTKRKMTQSLKTPETKRALNKELFTIVAKKYNTVTKLLSFGCDYAWKKALVEGLPLVDAPHCVDLACGTGDISELLGARYPKGQVMGVDITPAMLAVAQENSTSNNVTYMHADMMAPPVDDESIDIVTGGYALRNAPDLDKLLQTIWRKLKPGGTASFLDFSKSDHTIVQTWQIRLLIFWTGLCSLILHANPLLHNYIPASLKTFPTRKELQSKIEAMGFTHYRARYYHHGFIAEISFVKPV